MPLLTLAAFIFLLATFLNLWVRRDSKIWETLLGLSLLSGLVAGNITPIGLIFILVLLASLLYGGVYLISGKIESSIYGLFL